MKIDDCYKCGEPVREGADWEISLESGFICEGCNPKKHLTDEEYRENAAWLKSLSRKGEIYNVSRSVEVCRPRV